MQRTDRGKQIGCCSHWLTAFAAVAPALMVLGVTRVHVTTLPLRAAAVHAVMRADQLARGSTQAAVSKD